MLITLGRSSSVYLGPALGTNCSQDETDPASYTGT